VARHLDGQSGWVQIEREEWHGVSCKRDQIGRLDSRTADATGARFCSMIELLDAQEYPARQRRTLMNCSLASFDVTESQMLPQNSAEDCVGGACLSLHSPGCKED